MYLTPPIFAASFIALAAGELGDIDTTDYLKAGNSFTSGSSGIFSF
jgi:hypothetical protein